MISTELTRRLGLKYPIVLAPMGGVSGGELTGAVSAAGGLGMLGAGPTATVEWIAAQSALARPHGRFGIGLLTWKVDLQPELLDAALAEHPIAVSLSAGDPTLYVERIHTAGATVLAQVSNARLARQAIDAGVDVLVAQGAEAGGHTGPIGILPLLQQVLEIGDEAGIPVLAAGGIATGRAIAGVLAMGGAGVWVGTRFAATLEALGRPEAKQAILKSEETETVRTHVFDIAQRLPWPDEFPGRALRNRFTERWHGHEEELQQRLEEVSPALEAARKAGDYDQMYVYAGQAIGLIHDVPPAGDLVRRLAEEAEQHLRRASGLVRDEGARA